MRKYLLSVMVLGLLTLSAAAQRVEVFGGYQFTHFQPSFNPSGWNAAVTGNFKHVFGITGDVGAGYKDGVHIYTYTAGPVITARLPVVQPFVHALFGGATVGSNGSSTNGFAMLFGGGLDVGWRKGLGIRLAQVDWLTTRFSGTQFNKNVRASAGIVLKF